jgi:hypothetical protein
MLDAGSRDTRLLDGKQARDHYPIAGNPLELLSYQGLGALDIISGTLRELVGQRSGGAHHPLSWFEVPVFKSHGIQLLPEPIDYVA